MGLIFAKNVFACFEQSGQGKKLQIRFSNANNVGATVGYAFSFIFSAKTWKKVHVGGPQISGGDINICKYI